TKEASLDVGTAMYNLVVEENSKYNMIAFEDPCCVVMYALCTILTHKALSSSNLKDRFGYATNDIDNSKWNAFEESMKWWRAEENAN
ncbi:hypothetical protein M8C21_014632, partial [Ambrosia artemisiifolia]